jgi:hypothetical protein
MTITTTTLRAQYNGNGVTTSFAVPFEFLEGSTVKVILTSVAGVDTVKTLTTHYTVTGGGTVQPATGSVVMITPPATGEKLTILRAQPLTQAASYSEGDAFPAKTHEKALDRIDMQVQMLSERSNRALKLKETSANSDLVFPEPEADKVISWNSDGTALENKALTDLEDGLYGVLDEDDMASDSATDVPTQQSVKAYADTKASQTTDRASLAGLSGATNPVVFVKDFADQDWRSWDGSDLSPYLLGSAISSSAVDAGTETITSVGHGLVTRQAVITTTAVNGLALDTLYYAIRVDGDNFRLATSIANAQAGTAFNLTGTTAVTVKKHFDPNQDRVTIKTGDPIDGSSGGFVVPGSLQTGGYFSDDGTPGRVRRVGGSLMVGAAAGAVLDRVGFETGTWLDEDFGSAYVYIATNPQLMVAHELGGSAVVGLSRSSDNPGAASSNYGIPTAGLFFTLQDNVTPGQEKEGWAVYSEMVRLGGTPGSIVHEMEMTNLGSDARIIDPYFTQAGETVAVLGLGVGGGGIIQNSTGRITGTPDDISCYISMGKAAGAVTHDARAYKGISFGYNGLVRSILADETSDADAIDLARGHGIVWNNTSGAITARIRGAGSTSARRQVLQFGDTTTSILGANADSTEHAILSVFTPIMGSGVGANGVTVSGVAAGGGGPRIEASGSDTNIALNLRGKGSLGGNLQDSSGNAKFTWSGSGLSFYGGTAVARTSLAAATGTATRTTFDTASVTLPQLAERVKAMIDDFRANGMFA